MSGPEERERAVDLYSAMPMTAAQVVGHLGYPARRSLERWLVADPRYAGHMAKPIIPLETRAKGGRAGAGRHAAEAGRRTVRRGRRAAGAFRVGAILFSNQYGPLGQTQTAKELLQAWTQET